MEREAVVTFIQQETKRLREEEHLDDLVKANCFDELKQLECRIIKPVSDFIREEGLWLEDKEIQEGNCTATAIWFAICTHERNEYLFINEEKFAFRMAREEGLLGKNLAAQMLDGADLYEIDEEDFFSDRYVKEFDEKYRLEGAFD